MKKITLDQDPSDALFEFIDRINQDPTINFLTTQLRNRYYELEKESGFDNVMKHDDSFEVISDMMEQHTRDIDPNDTDIFTYLWYNA